jgi:CheY-like chemotaxis protein
MTSRRPALGFFVVAFSLAARMAIVNTVSSRLSSWQALDEAKKLNPDPIILDYLPGKEQDGWAMFQHRRQQPVTKATPIIQSTTATTLLAPMQAYINTHTTAVIQKPFDLDELLRLIAHVLEGMHWVHVLLFYRSVLSVTRTDRRLPVFSNG